MSAITETKNQPRRAWRVGMAVLAMAAATAIGAGDVLAAGSCTGQYQTSQLYPWPAGVTFNPALQGNDENSRSRVAAFEEGLRAGGVTVDENSAYAMQVVFSFLPGRGGSTDKADVYPDLQWNSGRGSSTGIVRPQLVGQILNLTIIVTDNNAYRQMWIGTMQCTIRNADTQVLARDVGEGLGRTLAASLGKR